MKPVWCLNPWNFSHLTIWLIIAEMAEIIIGFQIDWENFNFKEFLFASYGHIQHFR